MYYRYTRMGICIMACLGLFLSLSYATSFAQKSGQPKFALTKADSGKTITAHVADVIAITLAENPSTGYTWAIDQTNANILKSLGSKYVQNPAPSGFAGVPGNRTFLFQALKQGTIHLKLKYWQAGSGNIADRFDVTINVKSISQPKFALTKANSGKTITVRVADEITITLTENSSTGYTWAIDQTNANILKSLGSKYVQNPAPSGFVGVPGNRTFLFQALKQGTVHLKLKYWRAWSGSIADQFDVTINVNHAS